MTPTTVRIAAALAFGVLGVSLLACDGILGISQLTGNSSDAGTTEAGDDATANDATADATGDAKTSDGPTTGDAHDDAMADAGPSCPASQTCAPPPGNGWQGPVALYEGNASAPACAGSWTKSVLTGNDALVAGNASCAQCNCGPSSGATPNVTDFFLYNSSAQGCNGVDCPSNGNAPSGGAGTCVSSAPPGCSSAVYADPACVMNPGTCTPSGGALMAPPPAWGINGVACGQATPSTTSCTGTAGTCVPTPPSTYNLGLCIYQAGLPSSCPGPYPKMHVLYQAAKDTRNCSACSCVYAGLCITNTEYCTDSACTQNCIGIPNATCGTITQGSYLRINAPTVQDDYCTPQGGALDGGVVPATPTTFCCNQ